MYTPKNKEKVNLIIKQQKDVLEIYKNNTVERLITPEITLI